MLDILMHGRAAASALGRPGAGPAIIVSFLLVLVACLFAGLCFAELASMIPIAGSTYTYAYAILGEIFAWIIGWDLILEYAVANMSVAVGFSAYLQDLGDNIFGFHLPAAIAYPMFAAPGSPAGIYNVPALLITMAVTWVLVRGVRESANSNTVMVMIKIAAILLFVFGAARAINTRQLASIRAERPGGRGERREHRFFHLRRLRRGFDRRAGMPPSAARRPVRHHRDADHLHAAVRFGFAWC